MLKKKKYFDKVFKICLAWQTRNIIIHFQRSNFCSMQNKKTNEKFLLVNSSSLRKVKRIACGNELFTSKVFKLPSKYFCARLLCEAKFSTVCLPVSFFMSVKQLMNAKLVCSDIEFCKVDEIGNFIPSKVLDVLASTFPPKFQKIITAKKASKNSFCTELKKNYYSNKKCYGDHKNQENNVLNYYVLVIDKKILCTHENSFVILFPSFDILYFCLCEIFSNFYFFKNTSMSKFIKLFSSSLTTSDGNDLFSNSSSLSLIKIMPNNFSNSHNVITDKKLTENLTELNFHHVHCCCSSSNSSFSNVNNQSFITSINPITLLLCNSNSNLYSNAIKNQKIYRLLSYLKNDFCLYSNETSKKFNFDQEFQDSIIKSDFSSLCRFSTESIIGNSSIFCCFSSSLFILDKQYDQKTFCQNVFSSSTFVELCKSILLDKYVSRKKERKNSYQENNNSSFLQREDTIEEKKCVMSHEEIKEKLKKIKTGKNKEVTNIYIILMNEMQKKIVRFVEKKYKIKFTKNKNFLSTSEQPRETLSFLKNFLENQINDFVFQAIYVCSSKTRSLLFSLFLLDSSMPIEQIFLFSNFEEFLQRRTWGFVYGSDDLNYYQDAIDIQSALLFLNIFNNS